MNPSDFEWQLTNGLQKLKEELNAYRNEENLWIVTGNITNSAGNLAQHLVGNLKHFVGLHMGQVAYHRQRDLEFSGRQADRARLLSWIDETIHAIHQALSGKEPAFLDQPFDETLVKVKDGQTRGFMLSHLYAHLNYHLGQINYHRRLLDQA